MRYSTLDLLAATAFVALALWCMPAEPYDFLTSRLVIAIVLVGAGCAIYFRRARPCRAAAIAGFTIFAVNLLVFWVQLWIGWRSHDKPYPYFEDGLIEEGFIYPVVYCVIYGPMATAIAAVAAVGTTGLLWLCSSNRLQSILTRR